MKKLQKYLSDWAENGLITGVQAESILEYETSKSSDVRTRWVLYGFIILGVVVIGIGVISLIAANWERIPPMVKLINNLLFLSAVAFTVYKVSQKDNDIVFDALLALFVFLCLGSIGLISQVFHTGGELFQALAFWLVIVFPATLLGRRIFLVHLWCGAAVITYLQYAFSRKSYWYNLQSRHDFDLVYAIFIFLPFILLLLSQLFKRVAPLRRHGEALLMWTLPSLAGAIIWMDIFLSSKHMDPVTGAALPVLIVGIPAAIISLADKEFSKREKVIVSVMSLLTLLILLPHEFSSTLFLGGVGKFFGALYTLVMLLLAGMIFIIRNNKKLFHLVTLLMGVRFLVVYFQVFENLATTGFGLIISGLIIIGAAMLWFKKRDNLEGWLRGALQ